MTLQQTIGVWKDVSIEMAAWDGVMAAVDLSCACMFEREIGGGDITGGLKHLDVALDGSLSAARRSSAFRGARMETWLLEHSSSAVQAGAVLIVGLGDPDTWTPSVSGMAVSTAFRTAMRRRAVSCAFAPSLLDAGFAPSAISGVAETMMQAVLGVIAEQAARVEAGLTDESLPRRWVFDVGTAHFNDTAEQFRLAFSSGTQPG